MAVFQMLTEVIRAEKFLRLVALSELVDMVQVLRADLPLWGVGKLLTAIATRIRVIGVL